ncbi:GntR family transcriptional regulator [Bordetella pertussis]|uniref:GntR family transcriptional regulator n=25 Tax=Bordetella pertussis TaxID=520 RepID=Q7W0I2_BORPE|nr:GntR family transcriptional regulator [Bordetella pertussis]AEE65642.1 GntR family transcriptional regulator [Bordetella pertussis CS]AIW90728.1 GntR family transcriptional regulator [Bordetella pertussis B1917]AIW94188.1 GntR family transcriptional regulator [Bordetella pertussis B1920]AJB25120.1 GntR family transcriptional regulator [Bordetella pertussis 137]ALH47777.1 GntR family transcriptional regulator [Bordetella pertussis]
MRYLCFNVYLVLSYICKLRRPAAKEFILDVKAPATIPYFLKEQIRELIVDGTFRPGQPLREQDLEQRFGTSRSPIREALRLLERGGLVVHLQRKGFRIRRYSQTEIRQVYMLYAELEAYSIMQLSEAADSPLLDDLRRHEARIAQAQADADVRGYIGALRDFYLASARFTGNVPLADTLSRLYEQVEPLRYNLVRRTLAATPADQYHRGIVPALAQRDLAGAARQAHVLVREMLPRILSAYEQWAGDAGDEPGDDRLRVA